MNILVVTAGYSIFDAKGQLNSFLAYLTEKSLTGKGHKVKISDVTKDTWSVDREIAKLLWAETIIYITPIMWFNMPAPLVKWFGDVLLYEKTFVITDEYGEGGQVSAENFMVVTTSNMKSSDLGKGAVLKDAPHIDDVLQPIDNDQHLSQHTQSISDISR
ncbi:MAG: NAD(P)H-dependent oxidoreductase [Granulosicoccus sp.]